MTYVLIIGGFLVACLATTLIEMRAKIGLRDTLIEVLRTNSRADSARLKSNSEEIARLRARITTLKGKLQNIRVECQECE